MQQTAGPELRSVPQELTSALAELVQSEKLDLPILPEVATQVITASMDSECDLRKLSTMIKCDPPMTANLLRLANSALYSTAVEITSIHQALSRLGLKKVRELALVISCESRVFRVEGFNLTVRKLFRHSLATAVYAQELAKRLGAEVEEAFLCGLLHDVGRAVLIQAIADFKRSLHIELDREVVEALSHQGHCQVGAQLVTSWKLPAHLGPAILHHHDPLRAGECKRMAMITRLADDLAHLALATAEITEEQLIDHPLLDPLGFDREQIGQLLSRAGAVREAIESMA